jgi:predicted nucleotidyltransferase
VPSAQRRVPSEVGRSEIANQDIVQRAVETIRKHPAVDALSLVGSRARGEARPLSDWDFEIETSDFRAVAEALPELVATLEPLAQQWDRLSARACYMLTLQGIGKVDLIFDEPWETSPPWKVSAETLQGIDDHFWDWTIWLAAKDQAGKQAFVRTELWKMQENLLGPLGVDRVPGSVREAVAAYSTTRAAVENRLGLAVRREVETEVRRLLVAGGYAI